MTDAAHQSWTGSSGLRKCSKIPDEPFWKINNVISVCAPEYCWFRDMSSAVNQLEFTSYFYNDIHFYLSNRENKTGLYSFRKTNVQKGQPLSHLSFLWYMTALNMCARCQRFTGWLAHHYKGSIPITDHGNRWYWSVVSYLSIFVAYREVKNNNKMAQLLYRVTKNICEAPSLKFSEIKARTWYDQAPLPKLRRMSSCKLLLHSPSTAIQVGHYCCWY